MNPDIFRIPPDKAERLLAEFHPSYSTSGNSDRGRDASQIAAVPPGLPPGTSPVAEQVVEFLASDKGRQLVSETEERFTAAYHRDTPARAMRQAVKEYRKQLCQTVREHVLKRIYELNAQGVEWFGARAGWIFLADHEKRVLRSVPEAAFNTGLCELEIPIDARSIVAHVCQTKEAYWTNDVSEVPFYQQTIAETRSELCVPLFRPDGTVLGAYNVEAAHRGAFTAAQSRELQKKVAFFIPHLLVLEDLEKSEEFGSWPWHPELHGWDPERLLTEFCRVVAQRLAHPNAPPPAATVFYVDNAKSKAWAISVFGYDYTFLNIETLGLRSAVAQVALDPARTIQRGTPQELHFERLNKAVHMNVKHAVIAPMGTPGGDDFCGTFNLYFFEDRPAAALPTDETVRWLAEYAERIVAGINSRRQRVAVAYLYRELAKDASSSNAFASFLRVLLRCLGSQAGTIYAHERGTEEIRCVETTGLEGVADHTQVKYHRTRNKDSYTCWLANHPGRVLRTNWGPVEEKESADRPADLPSEPSNHSRERMDQDGTYHRRSLGLGVKEGDYHAPELLGVIRILRSARAKPYVRADEQLFFVLAEESKRFFVIHSFIQAGLTAPDFFGPVSIRIEEVLQESVKGCISHDYPMLQASVFLRYRGSSPEYRLYAYHSQAHQTAPVEFVLEDEVVRRVWAYDGKIVVVPFKEPQGADGLRICVPLQVWSGPHLDQAIFALDYRGTGHTWSAERKKKVFGDARRLVATWAKNNMRANREFLKRDDTEILGAFLRYVTTAKDSKVRWARLRLLNDGEIRTFDAFGPAPPFVPELQICPDSDLKEYGVSMAADGTCCSIPLMLGPIPAGELVCGLDPELARTLAEYAGQLPYASLSGRDTDAQDIAQERRMEAFFALRDVAGFVTGPWCRLVAGDLPLWDVTFGGDRHDDEFVVWDEAIRVRPEMARPFEGWEPARKSAGRELYAE